MEEITMYRAEDGKMFNNEDECRAYEVEFVVRKYEKIIKFWDSKKCPISLIDVLTNGKNYEFDYFQIQRVAANYYSDLVDDLSQYVELDMLYEHEENIGDIIFYDETIGRTGDWVSLDKRAEEARTAIEELRGY